MEENNLINWGDCRLYIGGEEITTFASVDLAVPGSDTSVISEVVSHNGELTVTGTIHISKKQAKAINKLFKLKKRRLPRKLKKKLKKNFYRWASYYFPGVKFPPKAIFYNPRSPLCRRSIVTIDECD